MVPQFFRKLNSKSHVSDLFSEPTEIHCNQNIVQTSIFHQYLQYSYLRILTLVPGVRLLSNLGCRAKGTPSMAKKKRECGGSLYRAFALKQKGTMISALFMQKS